MTPFGYTVLGFGSGVSGDVAMDQSIPAGDEAIFYSAAVSASGQGALDVQFDPNDSNKFVICYQNGSPHGEARVGTITGTTISYGTAVEFNTGGNTDWIKCEFDPNTAGKFVVVYRDGSNSNYGSARVGTVSGTDLSFGTEVVFNSGNTQHTAISFDPNTAEKFVVGYKDWGNSGYGTAIVGTRSGTDVSFGTAVAYKSASVYDIDVCYDPSTANKFAIVHKDSANSYYGSVFIADVSGTTPSFGSEVIFNSGNTNELSVNFDPNTALKFAITYRDHSNSGKGTAIAATVSGTTPTFGSEHEWNQSEARYTESAFDPNNAGQMVVICRDEGFSYKGTATVLTLSGTSFSSGTTVLFMDSEIQAPMGVAVDPNNSGKFVVAYRDEGNSGYGTAVVGQMATI